MKTPIKVIYSFLAVLLVAFLCSASRGDWSGSVKFSFPYKKAGLTERQAAAHLLSRFTYGSKEGDVDAVVKMGLEKWFKQQLDGNIADDSLQLLLNRFEDINLSNTEVENKYPKPNRVLKRAIEDGSINKDSVNKGDQKVYREQIKAYMERNGLKPEQELYRQFINQKILRATYTNNQLRELLTDFWFNHFNVSLVKNQCASFIPAYERDVIRPNVTGKFGDLLLATAKSPAMLVYLDNFTSTGQPVRAVSSESRNGRMNKSVDSVTKKTPPKKRSGGLNENYAREVMELHTLGVDGGYTQSDVTQAARALTGWGLAPMGEAGPGAGMKKTIENIGADNLKKRGFIKDGDFLFVPAKHDNEEKTVLGKKFPAGGGYEEGVALLNMLAHHPSTAKFISKKLATRFVNDAPPQSLVDKMAKTFIKTDGNIREVMITMASAPEFWSPVALRQKTKSPFELAISAVRGLDAEVTQPYQLFNWINRMGQKMYYYQAPTGFPDRGQYWINTGALLNRMNFGLALAAQRIPGVRINLSALNHHHEPESAEAALVTYSQLIMPERNLTETFKRLKPMLSDPVLQTKVAAAADKIPVPTTVQSKLMASGAAIPLAEKGSEKTNKKDDLESNENKSGAANEKTITASHAQKLTASNAMLAQVVGVIIGSPEFQRK